jgi:hypothetical protein
MKKPTLLRCARPLRSDILEVTSPLIVYSALASGIFLIGLLLAFVKSHQNLKCAKRPLPR